ncbi:DNA topoisomerase IB [Lewinella sp. W8]|uniref:DNA topoisomerase IB n=1 Tax=Lewinella sp. W8 TaxID=2528208 RepID=UPI0010677A38|nr:DNA topoisomerase IB [Lewinella sp. W8]MTB52636.1 DNA topoisomerase IB [Lewinella sp. W8]
MGAHPARTQYVPPKLVHVSDDRPGWSRRRYGRGFQYLRENGSPIREPRIKARLRALAIPPAWTDVWICPLENGHLLCTGRDNAQRKQYRYHPLWLAYQQQNKFDRLIKFAARLPEARGTIRNLLTQVGAGWTRRRVTALALAIMDETGMRVGNAGYRKLNGTIGLTTLRRKHLEIDISSLHFAYPGKSGVDRSVDLTDPLLVRLIKNVSELPGYELFRYRGKDGKMHNLESADVNELVSELFGDEFSSKYFRTWAGTSAAVRSHWALKQENPDEERPDLRTLEGVAEELGNTVAVCREYYVHPAVLTAIREGNLPDASSITPQEDRLLGDTFEPEEIIAFRVCSA